LIAKTIYIMNWSLNWSVTLVIMVLATKKNYL